MSKCIVIAPHPDDETLGCGGTILKHKSNGDEVYWLIITKIYVEDGWSEKAVNKQRKQIEKVAKEYDFDYVQKLDFPAKRLDTIPMAELVEKINVILKELQPDTVYINNRFDIHTDHQVVFNAAISCIKNFRFPFIKRVYIYETISETEFSPPLSGRSFQPNVFVDVEKFFPEKCKIMLIYDNEVMESPFPRSIEAIKALGKYRGSRIGVDYAESFMLMYEKL